MARAELRLILLGLAATSVLAGCVGGSGPGTSPGGETAGVTPTARKVGGNREIEAPDVFQTTDSALWDGRPSLGGIWVASPEVTDPERVVMFNPATGKSINGALFRRERENPGPTLQLSSDAAEALGILAGQPTEIRVTALRKEEVEVPAEVEVDPAAADPAAKVPPDAPAPDAAAAETAALATAALDAADGTVAADGAAPDVAATGEGVVVDPAAPVEPPKKKTSKERRAEAKAKREAEKAAKAAAAAGIAPVEDGAIEGGATEGGAETGAPVDPAASEVTVIETAPLDATAAAAPAEAAPVAPAPEKKKTRRQIKAEEEAAAAAAAAATEAADPASAPTTAGRPIQIASFSKEENAKRAVEALAKIGIPAQPQQSERGGKGVWGVVAIGDAALLKKIKAAGFADAYFLQ
jgi:rare lipoprotein A